MEMQLSSRDGKLSESFPQLLVCHVKAAAGTRREGGACNRESCLKQETEEFCACVCFGEGTSGVARVKVSGQKKK